uniref:DEP domain-containing protein n=1 Tax=Mesocestoides corti TaxID=53468 RepID=A0A5K3F2B6_MESCO
METKLAIVILTLNILLNTLTPDALNHPHSKVFRIVEESPNGTEIDGISNYLQSFVEARLQATYQLLDSHEMLTRLLKIEPQTGRLFIDGRVDREALCPQSSAISLNYLDPDVTCVKQINILATVRLDDRQKVSVQTIPLKLVIQDVNDNEPSWNTERKKQDGTPILETSILEQGPVNKVLIPAAYDPDSGPNGEISYRLEKYRDPSNGDLERHESGPAPFTISGPVGGMLQLTPFQPIDYEKQSVYDLLLIASDAGTPPKVGTAHLRINVIDVNDEAPVFTQQIFSPPGGHGISERTHPGKVILNVTAIDGDASERNSRLTYSMVPSSNRLIEEIFSVHPDGRILLRHWLDYETLEPSHMVSSGTAAREAPPSKNKQFAFFVKATDSAPPPYEKTGTALVVIPIIDENDERPIITSRFLGPPELVKQGEAGVITENSTVPVQLAYIQARDPDFDGRDRVECSVPDNRNLSLKRITPLSHQQSTGNADNAPTNNDFLLSLEVPVDREITKMLRVRIHCTDDANNTADKLINIRVLDINDEAPSFLWPVFYFSVNENTKAPPVSIGSNSTSLGYRIGRVIAYDKDEGENARIVYKILPSIEIEEPKYRPILFPVSDYEKDIAPAQASDLFRIDSLTGELFALRSFDAEREKLIKFQVTAVDQPSNPNAVKHTGTSSVYVQISDMNDWSPVFYQVFNEDDRKSQQLYVTDATDESTTTDSYYFSIKENLPAYTLVGRIRAIDLDVSFWSPPRISGVNGSSMDSSRSSRGVTLKLAPGTAPHIENAFSVHSTSGQLRTTGPLDREAYANYTFNVIAVDKGPVDGVSRTSTALVSVSVEDENDNDPVFVRPAPESGSSKGPDGSSYLESGAPPLPLDSRSLDTDQVPVVAVNMPTGGGASDGSAVRPLVRIEAHDPDAGRNGHIRYAITAGNNDDLFYLDPLSGSLVLKSAHPFAKEAVSYLLQLEACDQGIPPRCATPARLRIVINRPTGSSPGSSGGLVYPGAQDTTLYVPPGRYTGGSPSSGAGGGVGYPDSWDNELFGEAAVPWASSRSKWEDKHRYLRGEYEPSGSLYRRTGVTVSEAVIICVAVIFAVFLCAALLLVYLVKRKSIYFSIGGKQKQRVAETPTNPDYNSGNYKCEAPAACESLETNEKTSVYRMVPCTQAPGKIVFVDNDFDRQNIPEGSVSDTLALNPIPDGKRVAASLQDYGLRRGMSASAAVLTNLESVYITSPGASDYPMGTSEYPDVVTRSAFNYPQTVSRERIQTNEVPPAFFGTFVGPNGCARTVNFGQHSEYDSTTFQRRCASLRPNHSVVSTSTPYRYVHPPYVYTPIIGSPPSHVVHCRGISEPNNNAKLSSYSPQNALHRQPYVFTDDRHAYNDLDLLSATLQRQPRPMQQFVEIAPPAVSSPPYGRLRQPITNYTVAAPNNRYAVVNSRMVPDGEITPLMEPVVTLKRVRVPTVPSAQEDVVGGGTSEEGGSEAFDQRSSPNSLSEAFIEAEFKEHEIDDEEDEESITDPNAKLLTSMEEQTMTTTKPRSSEGEQLTKSPHHQPESESQATEEIMVSSETGFPSSNSGNPPPPPPLPPPTYTVHEASFV